MYIPIEAHLRRVVMSSRKDLEYIHAFIPLQTLKFVWRFILVLLSGSTGTPKGVVLTHGNMAFTLGAFLYNLDPLPGDMYIAYLPLAHVLELLGELNHNSINSKCMWYMVFISFLSF